MSQLTLNTKKMQLSKHDLLQRKKKRIRRKLKRLNDVALVGSECCCTWPPHSISSRIKTHHIMTDTTAVTIWIPLRSVYNVKKKKKMHRSQVWASILRNTPIWQILTALIATGVNMAVMCWSSSPQGYYIFLRIREVIFCHRQSFVSNGLTTQRLHSSW